MFSFTVSFSPTKLKTIKQSRTRVIGDTEDGKLLILVNTQQNTNVELCSADGTSTTAISFSRYIDIVSASLSPDKELLHIVERVPSPKGFNFRSKIIHIFGRQESREIESTEPVAGIFLPFPQAPQKKPNGIHIPKIPTKEAEKSYQMLHFIGPKLTHLSMSLKSSSIDLKIIRGGINLPKIVAYRYFHDTSTLACVYQDDKLMKFADFHFIDGTIKSRPPIVIDVNPKSFLPAELALNPSAQIHLPVFRTQRRRFFFARANSQYVIIQQLYSQSDSYLSFNIATYPAPFSQNISVRGIPPDHPICCYSLKSLFVLFVPNKFSITIDLKTSPPTITKMPQMFAMSECGPIANNLLHDNTIIDLVTGDIFKVDINFTNMRFYKEPIDRLTLTTLATICARLDNAEVLSSYLKYLEDTGNEQLMLPFMRAFIQDFVSAVGTCKRSHSIPGMVAMRKVSSLSSMKLSPHVDLSKIDKIPRRRTQHSRTPPVVKDIVLDIQKEFPSAGKFERSNTFKDLFLKYSMETDCGDEAAAEKALKILKRQNEGTIVLRKMLDNVATETSPVFSYLTKLVVATETMCESLPVVPCLSNELTEETEKICPKVISAKLSSNKVTKTVFTAKEASFWREKIPSYLFEKRNLPEISESESESSVSTSTASSSTRYFIQSMPRGHSARV